MTRNIHEQTRRRLSPRWENDIVLETLRAAVTHVKIRAQSGVYGDGGPGHWGTGLCYGGSTVVSTP